MLGLARKTRSARGPADFRPNYLIPTGLIVAVAQPLLAPLSAPARSGRHEYRGHVRVREIGPGADRPLAIEAPAHQCHFSTLTKGASIL